MIRVVTPKIGLDGCSWYRSRLPLDKAKELGLIDLRELDTDKQDTKEIMELIKGAEVFYLRFSMAKAAAFIRDIKENYPQKKIVFDTDDDLLNVNYLSDSYATFGTKEIYKEDGTPIWKEGTQFDPYDNRKRMIDYEYCLSKADIVTVTTLHLAETVKAFNPNVAVIPNAIDFNRFPQIRIDKGDELRLLWHGGASHYQDLWSVKADLDRLMKDYPNLHFYLYGQPFPAITKDMPKERVHTAYWINADGHGYRLATVGADVAICPLVESDFNQNKSSIKFYENSALKIPTVAKKMLPYEADIVDGKTGLLYTNNLYSQVKKLLDSKTLRARLGQGAYDWVQEHRNLSDIGRDLGQLLASLTTEEDEWSE
jgi:glycosyltransferase involved in cell wall biosynthesis